MDNKVDATTKQAPKDINQDGIKKEDQQRTDDSVLDMMQGLHDHEDHSEETDEQAKKSKESEVANTDDFE